MLREQRFTTGEKTIRAWREKKRVEQQKESAARRQQQDQEQGQGKQSFSEVVALVDVIGESFWLKGAMTPSQAMDLQVFCRVALRHQGEWFQEWLQERGQVSLQLDYATGEGGPGVG